MTTKRNKIKYIRQFSEANLLMAEAFAANASILNKHSNEMIDTLYKIALQMEALHTKIADDLNLPND